MFSRAVVLSLFLLAPSLLPAQGVNRKCFTADTPCSFAMPQELSDNALLHAESPENPAVKTSFPDPKTVKALPKPESDQISFKIARPQRQTREHFHWGPALAQSMEFLTIEHGYRMATSYWARYNMRGPFVRDWLRTVQGVRFTRWDDGDPFLCNYIGHPIQGSVTGYIQIQNDPRGRSLKISKSREYWHSRLRATAWAAVYSAQFEIGPISEASLGNLGSYEYRTDSGKMTNGTGLVDFVVTPVIGLGWMLLEDVIDRYVSDKLERRYNNQGTRILRGALNPSRTMSNLLRLKKPWYRDAPPTRR